MNPHLRQTLSFALLAAFASVLIGCGSSKEDEKPPSDPNYYKGEMAPKGGGAPKAGGKTGTD